MAGKKQIDKKNLTTRVIVGILMAVVIIACWLIGKWTWYGLVTAVSMVGLWEFYRMYGIEKEPLGITGFLMGIVYYAVLGFGKEELLSYVILASFLLMMAVYVFTFKKSDDRKIMTAFFGYFYAVVLISFLFRIYLLSDALLLLGLLIISSWGTDTFAYFTGILLGKHKMAPVLSPKKSIEGAIGGVFFSVVLSLVFAAVFGDKFTMLSSPYIQCPLICLASSLLSMVGDLGASAFKRNQGIKDYSHIFPGHGGVLDRFDSIMFVAPVIYMITTLIAG